MIDFDNFKEIKTAASSDGDKVLKTFAGNAVSIYGNTIR
jgi:GGDEF domain-containing protein